MLKIFSWEVLPNEGFECDVRWAADLEPVICHDPDLNRQVDWLFSDGAAKIQKEVDRLRQLSHFGKQV